MEERGDGSGGPAGQPGSFTCFDLDDSRGYVFDGILPYKLQDFGRKPWFAELGRGAADINGLVLVHLEV